MQAQKVLRETHYETAHQLMGDNRSTYRGYGLDYEESRPYQPGDEPRYINWPLAARTGELYMKVFREERGPGVFIVVDRRTSMRFGTRTRLKVTQAARVASCIAIGAEIDHATVGGVVLNAAPQGQQWIKQARGEPAAQTLIHAACSACPPATLPAETQHDPAQHGEVDFGQLLDMLDAILIPGTRLYLISDFIDLQPEHRARLMQLSTQHQVHAIHIIDPAEQHLPRVGMARIQAITGSQTQTIDTDATSITEAYQNAADKHFAERKQLFNALNIAYTPISTMIDAVETELLAR